LSAKALCWRTDFRREHGSYGSSTQNLEVETFSLASQDQEVLYSSSFMAQASEMKRFADGIGDYKRE
jgi:hypothetical protein